MWESKKRCVEVCWGVGEVKRDVKCVNEMLREARKGVGKCVGVWEEVRRGGNERKCGGRWEEGVGGCGEGWEEVRGEVWVDAKRGVGRSEGKCGERSGG